MRKGKGPENVHRMQENFQERILYRAQGTYLYRASCYFRLLSNAQKEFGQKVSSQQVHKGQSSW